MVGMACVHSSWMKNVQHSSWMFKFVFLFISPMDANSFLFSLKFITLNMCNAFVWACGKFVHINIPKCICVKCMPIKLFTLVPYPMHSIEFTVWNVWCPNAGTGEIWKRNGYGDKKNGEWLSARNESILFFFIAIEMNWSCGCAHFLPI